MSDRCWSVIGVRGDASCPQLTEHVHCRNCPVYSAAALALLDREPPSERSLRTRDPNRMEKAVPPQSDLRSVMVFRLAQEWLALPTALCREVGRRTRIHRLPGRGERLLGVANFHGELLVCVSLHRILELSDEGDAKRSQTGRFLVLEHAGGSVVCPVDEACGIARYYESELALAPATPGASARDYKKAAFAWQERSVALLDEELVRLSLAGSFASTPT